VLRSAAGADRGSRDVTNICGAGRKISTVIFREPHDRAGSPGGGDSGDLARAGHSVKADKRPGAASALPAARERHRVRRRFATVRFAGLEPSLRIGRDNYAIRPLKEIRFPAKGRESSSSATLAFACLWVGHQREPNSVSGPRVTAPGPRAAAGGTRRR
jgi:hypothetical protein